MRTAAIAVSKTVTAYLSGDISQPLPWEAPQAASISEEASLPLEGHEAEPASPAAKVRRPPYALQQLPHASRSRAMLEQAISTGSNSVAADGVAMPRKDISSYTWTDDGFTLKIIIHLSESVPRNQVSKEVC